MIRDRMIDSSTQSKDGNWLLQSWRLVALLLVALLVLAQSTQRVDAQSPPAAPNLEIIILLDESGSMWTETDPTDRRGDTVELFINALGVDHSFADFQAAIITFSDGAELIGNGFTSVKTAAAREELLEAFRAERSNTNGWTNVLEALERSRVLLDDHNTAYKPIIVVITDGQPETLDANDELPEALLNYTETIKSVAADDFDEFFYGGAICPSASEGASIYTIAIRNADQAANYSAEERELWQTISSLSGGGYEEILPSTDLEFQERLQRVFFDLLRDWLCIPIEDTEVTQLPDTRYFEVNASQAALYFQISKSDPNIDVQVFDPKGRERIFGELSVRQTTSANGLNESWGIRRPDEDEPDDGWVGRWRVVLTPTEDSTQPAFAQFTPYFASDSIRFDIISPAAPIMPLGSPMAVLASIIDNENDAYTPEDIANPLIRVKVPDGQTINYPVSIGDDGTLEAFVPELDTLGRYEITFSADVTTAMSETVRVEQKKFIDAATLPWLDVTSPRPNNNYPVDEVLSIDAVTMFGTERFDDTTVRNEVKARLFDIDNEELIDEYRLNPLVDDPTHFQAVVPVIRSGNYMLQFFYTSQPLGGQEYDAPRVTTRFAIDPLPPTPTPTATPIPPTATPAPTSTPRPTPLPPPPPPLLDDVEIPPAVFLICGLMVLLPLLGLLIWLFLRSRPSLEGIYVEDLSHAGNDVMFGSSYFGRKTDIIDRDGDKVATLHFKAGIDGTRVEVRKLLDGVLMYHGQYPIEQGEAFYPVHNDRIRIGNVTLRYDNEADTLGDYEEFEYGS